MLNVVEGVLQTLANTILLTAAATEVLVSRRQTKLVCF